MQTVYYRHMPRLAAALLLVASTVAAQSQNNPQTSKPSHAAYVDSHEGMTIAVDPWTTPSRYKDKFPKKSPFAAGVVALQVSFNNENEKGVKVDLQRIRLILQMDEDTQPCTAHRSQYRFQPPANRKRRRVIPTGPHFAIRARTRRFRRA